MSRQDSRHQSSDFGLKLHLPWMFLLFVGSGCAALIYEVVWFEMLELIIGSSAVSIGVLLATFMGGMCAGSLGLSRVISPHRHPLRVYALLELGIGLLGLGILFGLPYLGGLYLATGAKGMNLLFLRGFLSGVCLLPPTLLMGATLPAIARGVEATAKGMSWLGFFYGGNTSGAVIGSLLAGFYLLRRYDVAAATYAAASINLLVALAAFGLGAITSPPKPVDDPKLTGDPVPLAGSWVIFVVIALSGMTALSAEVVWTRLLSLMLGGTVYTFSLILAAFLLGLGIGSGAGSLLSRSPVNARSALGWCQFLLLACIAWAGFSLTRILPYWPGDPELTVSPALRFLVDFLKCMMAVLPAACLWGASFPLALVAAASRGDDPGRLVGSIYAANTAGAILGALGSSLLIIGWLGTQGAQRVMIALAASGAVLVFLAVARDEPGPTGIGFRDIRGIAMTVVLAGILIWAVRPVPGLLVAYGRSAARFRDMSGEFIYVGEGMNSSMAVSRLSSGVLNYHNAGKVQASSETRDMRLQRMLGHLTTLVPENPRSVLVIGCGAGVTAGAVSIDPAVKSVTIAEIERLVPFVVSTYFSRHNFDVIRNPKVRVEIDDARHFLITTQEKFDAITSDPFDPWVRGAAMLYTREFFEQMKRHLNPGGVVTVFVQLYQSNVEATKSQFATFFEAFPEGTVWLNTDEGEGYDVVLLGQAGPSRIDLDSIHRRLRRPDYTPVALSLGEVDFYSAEDLFSTFGGTGTGLKPWLVDAQINRDRNLRLQYLAGLALGFQEQDAIYREFVKFRRYPEGLFTGSPERVNAMRARLGAYH